MSEIGYILKTNLSINTYLAINSFKKHILSFGYIYFKTKKDKRLTTTKILQEKKNFVRLNLR